MDFIIIEECYSLPDLFYRDPVDHTIAATAHNNGSQRAHHLTLFFLFYIVSPELVAQFGKQLITKWCLLA